MPFSPVLRSLTRDILPQRSRYDPVGNSLSLTNFLFMNPISFFDAPWKEATERFLKPCLQLCAPDLHNAINWNRKPTFLNRELQRIAYESQTQRQYVDQLVKVYLEDGSEKWILLHIEVQAQPEPEFAKRMYQYHARLWLHHQREVVSLAILADDQPSWRPGHYQWEAFGCGITFWYRVVKLLEFEEQELLASGNPFALFVLAHLQALRTRSDMPLRLQEKVRLVRFLYGQGYNREAIVELFRLMDWLLRLPEGLESRFEEEMEAIEEVEQMPLLSRLEEQAIERGLQKGSAAGSATVDLSGFGGAFWCRAGDDHTQGRVVRGSGTFALAYSPGDPSREPGVVRGSVG